MDVTGRLDRFQRRHRWAGFPLAVVYKYVDDQGAFLAALITYYGFLSLFPLLLLLVTVLGYALNSDPALQQRVLDSALNQFPVVGDLLGRNLISLRGSIIALIIGIAGTLYGGLGVAQAAQNAMNRMWAVPRNRRPNPLIARLRSLLVLLLLGGGLIVTTALTFVAGEALAFASALGPISRALSIVGAVAINSVLFTIGFRVLTARDLTVRDVRIGAVGAAIGWQLLQAVGALYVRHVLARVQSTYGVFGVVLGLMAYLLLASNLIVLCVQVDVVRLTRLWPRNLMTPFTDDVDLTEADRRAYSAYPQNERHKGFETVDVDFDGPPDPS